MKLPQEFSKTQEDQLAQLSKHASLHLEARLSPAPKKKICMLKDQNVYRSTEVGALQTAACNVNV
jgi:hypothetical protein